MVSLAALFQRHGLCYVNVLYAVSPRTKVAMDKPDVGERILTLQSPPSPADQVLRLEAAMASKRHLVCKHNRGLTAYIPLMSEKGSM